MEKKYKVSICGSSGMVGSAMLKYFQRKPNYTTYFYDIKGQGSLQELNQGKYIYICVPTPFVEGLGCDTSILWDAVSKITGQKIIIIKSTVTPGTTRKLQKEFPQHKFLFNPEFLTEVTADNDMNYPDRQIIGYTEESYTESRDVLQQLPLAPFERIIKSDEAEMIKYFGNNWFAVKVVFANQMYDLCQKLGIDYEVVKDGAAADKRIGRTHLDIFHKGGRGAGGKCLRKDLAATVELSDKIGNPLPLLKIAQEINYSLLLNFGKEKYV